MNRQDIRQWVDSEVTELFFRRVREMQGDVIDIRTIGVADQTIEQFHMRAIANLAAAQVYDDVLDLPRRLAMEVGE